MRSDSRGADSCGDCGVGVSGEEAPERGGTPKGHREPKKRRASQRRQLGWLLVSESVKKKRETSRKSKEGGGIRG